ncbi:MAG: multiheme c-type cytochrome [Candidatus Eiseniibacteriota bacterium]
MSGPRCTPAFHHTVVRRLLQVACALAVLLVAGHLPAVGQGQDADRDAMLDPGLDPARVVSAERCNACHGTAYNVWKKTKHATSYDTMHKREAAERIAAAMDERLIKRESVCIQCHYTPEVKRGTLRAQAGVSCESCHGSARDWINIHNNYGEGETFETESPEHRAMRIRESKANGMRRPSEIYPVAASCFRCHTVPNERLVNVGGHSSGADFELVERVKQIQHNFLQSLLHGTGEDNADPTQEHKRLLYVTGRALDLEYTLRAISAATEDGIYLKALSRRLRNARRALSALEPHVAEAGEMLGLSRDLSVAPNQADQFLDAASRVQTLTRAFLDRADGTGLEAIDPIIAGEAEPVSPEPIAGTPSTPAAGTPAGAPAATPGGTTSAPASPGAPQPPSEYGPAVSHLDAVHPAPTRGTVGSLECGRCHGPQSGWWFGDRHGTAAQPFFELNPKNVQIARAYGISPAAMRSESGLCMDCHAGRGAYDLQDGVSCESCHGNGADYLKPHQEGEKALGTQRPGYQKGLDAGMVELRKLETRAETCASCHYITDARLLWAGHPSGTQYDFAAGNQKIKHWDAPLAGAGQLAAAWQAVTSRRGPIPDVKPVDLASIQVASGSGQGGSGAASGASRPRAGGGGRSAAAGSTPAPTGPVVPVVVKHVEISEPFPAVSDSLPVDAVLVTLKQRLDYLYETLGAK